MQRHLRLTRGQDFRDIYDTGKSWANRLLVLRARPNNAEHNRYGVVASKRVGKAVKRNRIRRLVREGVRHLRIQNGWDMVFIARAAAAEAEYSQVRQAVVDLLQRARLLNVSGQDK